MTRPHPHRRALAIAWLACPALTAAKVSASDPFVLEADGATTVAWAPVAFPGPGISSEGGIERLRDTTAIAISSSVNELVVTTDAGATWSGAFDPIAITLDIEALDAKMAFASGLVGQILKTTDGGTTWSNVGFSDLLALLANWNENR